jgi:hypothetical protein
MATGTAQQIIAVKSPNFAADPRLSDFVVLAADFVSQSAYGTKYQHALALVVLHWLTLDALQGGSSSSSGSGIGGGIKSEKEGDLARTFGSPSSSANTDDGYWMSTVFGQELVSLRSRCVFTPHHRVSLGGVSRVG